MNHGNFLSSQLNAKEGLLRRDFFKSTVALAAGELALASRAKTAGEIYLSFFTADVTPPLGGPLFNGTTAVQISDPLQARGLLIFSVGKPIVIVAVQWCEIRNESYDRWRSVLAQAAQTDKERVLVSCVHEHDAPYTDVVAQRLLTEYHVTPIMCDPEFEERMIQRVASAVKKSVKNPRLVTHIGTGQGKVEKVASNRRYVTPHGDVSFERVSAERDPAIRDMPVGLIDPWLKTISFWNNEQAVAAISCYATHPMTYYGKGAVSCDFPGLALLRRQNEMPSVAQIYCTGCSGDITAGKFNDGSHENRPILAARVHEGMLKAWNNTKRHRLDKVEFRCAPMKLEARHTPGYSLDDFRRTLADNTQTRLARFDAALGLSWRERLDSGHHIDVPAIDLGAAQIVLLPAEAFVQYQLWAQAMRPDSFVMTLGYGECAPGYIPTAQAVAEGYHDFYSWIAFPECEATMRRALKTVLQA